MVKITAEIVAAYVSNKEIAMADLGGLITAVADRLSKAGTKPEQPAEEKPEAAVSVRRSIRPDHLVCLVCGQPHKMLKRHLSVRHDVSPAAYHERFGLKPDYPMTAPNTHSSGGKWRSQVAWVGPRSRLVGDVSQTHGRSRLTKVSKGDDAGAGAG